MAAWTSYCPVFAAKFDVILDVGSSRLPVPTYLPLLMSHLGNINDQSPSGFLKKRFKKSYLILSYLELFCSCCWCQKNMSLSAISVI